MLIAALLDVVPPISVQNVGWTWGATMGALTNIILGGGAVGIIGAILRAGVALKRIANERAKQDAQRDSDRWKELLEFNKSLQDDIDKLRTRVDKGDEAIREERRRCDVEMKALHDRIEGLQKSLLQHAASLGNMVSLPGNAPTTTAKLQGATE